MGAYLKTEKYMISILAMAVPLLVLFYQATKFTSESQLLPLVLLIVMAYAFLKNPLSKRTITKLIDWVLVIISIATGLYLTINFFDIVERASMPTSMDIIMGLLCLITLIEALRRTVGLGLTLICVAFLVYALFGLYFPDFLQHRGYSVERIVNQLYLGTAGIYGLPLATMFRYVVIFIIFGAVLEKTGVSNFMVDISRTIAGRLPGGTGHISVLSSALMGSVSGSAVANVMVGGNVTIPAMHKSGFSKRMAGAIEAVASNGGQILPPVMGAAAFLMAENLQVSYLTVAAAALIPGILYFLAVSSTVHFYSVSNGIKGIPKEEIPSLFKTLKEGWIYPIPFIVLIGVLIMGYSPTYAGLMATIVAVVCGFLNSKNRLTFKGFFEAIQDSGKGVVMLCIASAGAGIVMGVLTLTGLGTRFSWILVDLSGDSLIILLILAMLGSIILGMGMPTTVVYILLAALIAPALIDVGFNPLATHLFILYFGTISMLTPPVALASYAAAAISGDNPNSTSWKGFVIALPAYITPFCFIFNNELLLEGNVLDIILVVICTALGILIFTSGINGYFFGNLNIFERILIIVASLLLMTSNLIFVGFSVVLLVLMYFKKQKTPFVPSYTKETFEE